MLDRDDQKSLGGKGGGSGRDVGGKGGAAGGSARSGAGGGGGVRGGSSTASGGKRESAGSKATSSKAGAGPAGRPNNGPGGAGGVRKDTSGTGIGGLLKSTAEQRDARAKAVSRGSGILAGANPATSTPQAARRTATSLGLSMADRYGRNPVASVAAVREMVKTLAGETAGLPAAQQAAAARTMFNRMDAALAGIKRDRQYTTDPMGMLGAYDANGFRDPSLQNAGYRSAKPGTAAFADGLAAIASGMSPYGNLRNVSPAIQDSTHYLNKSVTLAAQGRLPGWAKSANNQFGPHSFGTPDMPAQSVQTARNQSLGGSPAFAKDQSRITPDMPMGGYRSPMAGLSGMPPARSNMNMGGYVSPMTGTMGMPQALSRMNMGGYQSPMASVGGMPPAPGRMDMGGYQSPMAGVDGLGQAVAQPGKIQDRIEPDVPSPMAAFAPPAERNPIGGMSFNPAPPRNPVGGMSFNPAPPRNPIGGMSFNPSMPRNPIGGMSFAPGLPGMMPGPSRSRSPAVSGEPQIAQGIPNQPGRTGPIGTTQPDAGGFAGLGETIEDAPAPQIAAPAPSPNLLDRAWDWTKEQVTPSPETQQKLRQAFDYGRFLTPPGPNNPTSRGGQGGGEPIQWTGREPPEMVAEMQQHVEQVLRAYLFQAPQAA